MAAKSNLTSMAGVLTLTCLLCSAILGGVYALTKEPIEQTNRNILTASIGAVLPEGSEVSEAVPAEVGGLASEYYTGTIGGEVSGYAVKSVTTGFGGSLELIVGLRPDGTVIGTSVLSHSETPGLGAKCTSDEHFISQWVGFNPAEKILAVKKDGGDVDAITASTITSRAYTLAVKNACEALQTITDKQDGGMQND